MRVQVTARNRACEFDATAGEKILYAGLRAQTALPYECATGTCGTCKAKLLEGRIADGWPEAPGRKLTRPEQGEFLMCQCTAQTDIAIQVGGNVPPFAEGAPKVDALSGRIGSVRALTHDVAAFDVALDAPCRFAAGQFMAISAPGVTGARGYSMVNFDEPAGRLDFVVKKRPGGGFSEWLFSGKSAGAPIRLFGPLGKATFEPGLDKNILMIAGGSGIAGMMSILECASAAMHFENYKGHVFFGIRTMRDAFFLSELSRYPVQTTVALSDEDVPDTASRHWPKFKFARGFVHEVAKQAMAGKYLNVRAYLAGPPPAVDAAIRFLLVEARIGPANIRYDKFS